jgi:energy-coupling factor transport system permease protein
VLGVAGAQGWAGVAPQQVPAVVPSVPLGLVAAILVGALAAVTAPVPPLVAGLRARRVAA